ncbi:hypothetical protein [Rhodococcus jostii]|uniref:hypothetical protein n=1 Tax=Rhodococcus jostii TaxID=132919 RepID=UPI003629DEC3
MTEFNFVDDNEVPEVRRGYSELYSNFAKALRRNSGRWAVWPRELKNSTTATSVAGNIKRGQLVSFPKGEFEARSRGSSVYVRHVGGVA